MKIERPVYHKHKIFLHNEPMIRANVGWRWPYVDIKFYKQNETHVYKFDCFELHKDIRLEHFYPIHVRPFAGMWLPTPHRTDVVLRDKYEQFRCRLGDFNHRYEYHWKASERVEIDCSRLIDGAYPYVNRIPLKNGTLEVIWDHDHIRYAAFINATCNKHGFLDI